VLFYIYWKVLSHEIVSEKIRNLGFHEQNTDKALNAKGD